MYTPSPTLAPIPSTTNLTPPHPPHTYLHKQTHTQVHALERTALLKGRPARVQTFSMPHLKGEFAENWNKMTPVGGVCDFCDPPSGAFGLVYVCAHRRADTTCGPTPTPTHNRATIHLSL